MGRRNRRLKQYTARGCKGALAAPLVCFWSNPAARLLARRTVVDTVVRQQRRHGVHAAARHQLRGCAGAGGLRLEQLGYRAQRGAAHARGAHARRAHRLCQRRQEPQV